MFNSGSSQFYYTSSSSGNTSTSYNENRLSFGGIDEQFTATQRQDRSSLSGTTNSFAKSRRMSVGESTATKQTRLDPPCRPATVAMLYKHRDSDTGIVKLHGSPGSSHPFGGMVIPSRRTCIYW